MVGACGLLEREVVRVRDDAEQFGSVLFQTRQVHFGQLGGCDPACFDERRQIRDGFKGELIEILKAARFYRCRRETGGLDWLGASGIEARGRFGIQGDDELAELLIIAERAIHVGQHHVEFGVLEFEADQAQGGLYLLFGDARRWGGRRRRRRRWGLRGLGRRGRGSGQYAEQFYPIAAIEIVHRKAMVADAPNGSDGRAFGYLSPAQKGLR